MTHDVTACPRCASTSVRPLGHANSPLEWYACRDCHHVWAAGVPVPPPLTAGPDTIAFGDNIGFDLLHNPRAQQYMQDFRKHGHSIGSHGGWIHDYYGLNVSETNKDTFLQYLKLNRDAIEAVVGPGEQREYSAPVGNNPTWAVSWLEQQGVVGYYFVGDTGMGPTRAKNLKF